MTPEERKREDQARKRRNARGASWAAKLERERLAFERKKQAAEVATQEAASLIFEHMADEIGRLVGLLEKGGAWRLSDALKELQKGARS